jgi:hypothetical protein
LFLRRVDGEARIIQPMDIEVIVAICWRECARAHTLFIDSLIIVFCRCMIEAEILKKVDEGGLNRSGKPGVVHRITLGHVPAADY